VDAERFDCMRIKTFRRNRHQLRVRFKHKTVTSAIAKQLSPNGSTDHAMQVDITLSIERKHVSAIRLTRESALNVAVTGPVPQPGHSGSFTLSRTSTRVGMQAGAPTAGTLMGSGWPPEPHGYVPSISCNRTVVKPGAMQFRQ
jgi:hypothetical protein